jgi:hypothetical protein
MSRTNKFLVRCNQCGGNTSTKYARTHQGLCKGCVEGTSAGDRTPTREQRILEHGYQAYAREEGHFDQGGDE